MKMKRVLFVVLVVFALLSGCESAVTDSGEIYSPTLLDKFRAECNVACCGEEFPASCEKECNWPEYMICFNKCSYFFKYQFHIIFNSTLTNV